VTRALQISQAEALIINIDELHDEQKQQIIKLLADHPDYSTLSVIVVSCVDLAKAAQSPKPVKRTFFGKMRGNQLPAVGEDESSSSLKKKTTPEEVFSSTPEILTRTTIVYATTAEAHAALQASNKPRSSTKRISSFRFSRRQEDSLASIPNGAEEKTADETSSFSKASWARKTEETDSLVDFIFSEIDDPRYQGCRISCVCTSMEMTVPTSTTTTARTARSLKKAAVKT